MNATRALRIGAIVAGMLAVLWIRFSSGVFPENEVSPVLHWGLLPIAFLLGLTAVALEVNASASVTRRDTLFGISAALIAFCVLRLLAVF
jgi:hypothetical protein